MSDEAKFTSSMTCNKNNSTLPADTVSSKNITVEAALSEKHFTEQDISSQEDVSLGDVDVSKEYAVRLRSLDTTVDEWIKVVLVTSGPTSNEFGRMRPGETFGPVRMIAQSGGFPKLAIAASTGTKVCRVEAFELGDPSL